MLKKIIKIIVGYLSKLTVEQEDVVGVDITPSCIRVAQLSSSKKKWSLAKLGYKYIDGVQNNISKTYKSQLDVSLRVVVKNLI